jgi:NitT/TauT family transport system ATP-binding protein
MTVIFVTHAIAEAAYLAERAIVFSRRPARIVADHRVDLPRARAAATRATPDFSRNVGALYEALERGGA